MRETVRALGTHGEGSQVLIVFIGESHSSRGQRERGDTRAPQLASPRMARLFGKLRYLVIVAVIGIGLQAVATFGWAAAITVDFIDDLVRTTAWQQDDTVVELLQVLDLYLIGTVLLITSIGLYELFIGDVQLPQWLVIRNLSDLKAKIVDVIVLVIGIKFLEKLVKGGEAIDILWYGLASAAVMAVLIGWNTLKSRG